MGIGEYPCKECMRRSSSCHGTCEAYKAVRAAQDAARKEREKGYDTNHYLFARAARQKGKYLRERLRGRKG